MTINELIAALQDARKRHGGETEVGVHCHGCCPYAHEIDKMAMGERHDETHMLLIEV